MTTLSFDEAAPTLEQLHEMAVNLKPSPIMFYPYLKRVLTEQWEKLQPKYPMVYNIPKSNKQLLKGDFTPERTITLNEPLRMSDGTPVWFESSADQIFLRFGYINCDARYISSEFLSMERIHGFLGGSSGHGKSVTLNSIIGALCYEYNSLELSLVMSDAKILEFKKYGLGHHIPHILTIAACEDPDFIVSVLEKAYDEMNERAKIFALVGASNLKSFRKKTGLTMSRVLIVMDEVESTFKLAGKRAQRISDLIDGFSRLGRAAGYHLLLCTQNLSADIPKSAVGQIGTRMCLGANQATSEAILGNSGGAENFGRIGRLIVNTDVLNGGNTYAKNRTYQTPFITDDNFEAEMKELEELGQKFGYSETMMFYDETKVFTLAQYRPVIDSVRAKSQGAPSVLLGYPSFVTEDPDGFLKLTFDHKDIENLIICSTQQERVFAHVANIYYSLKDSWIFSHFYTDKEIMTYTPNCAVADEVRDATQSPLTLLDSVIRRRLFMLQLDNLAGAEGKVKFDREEVEKLFEEQGIPQEYWGNGLVCRRAAAFKIMSTRKAYEQVWKPVSKTFAEFKNYFNECKKFNALIEPVTVEKFTQILYFLGDLSKIIGYGRDYSSKTITYLKKTLQDANRAGIVFVLYTRSLENLTDLVSGLRYAIFDAPESRDWTRMRTEAPAVMNPNLAVLFDSLDTTNPQKKFKRTLLREEY